MLRPLHKDQFLNISKNITRKNCLCTLQGFYFQKLIWTPSESEVLSCEYKENDPRDVFPIKTYRENERLIVHLPMEISRITKNSKLSETYCRCSPSQKHPSRRVLSGELLFSEHLFLRTDGWMLKRLDGCFCR